MKVLIIGNATIELKGVLGDGVRIVKDISEVDNVEEYDLVIIIKESKCPS